MHCDNITTIYYTYLGTEVKIQQDADIIGRRTGLSAKLSGGHISGDLILKLFQPH